MTDHLANDPRHAAGSRARGAEAAAGYVRAGSDPAQRPRPATTGLRSALWVPPFGDLADPVVVARLAAEAEEAGWHGVFVWDHLAWRARVRQVADPWITLAAAATATERLRLGPMVTPLARRRPAKVARETVTLDWLSGGRLTLGVGLGSDHFGGELSATGEQLDDRRRGQMLDEALEILTAAWSGQSVYHRGEYYTVDGVQFLPQPVRQRVPVWVAGFPGKIRPLRRAARYDGFFPVNLERPGQLAEITATIAGLRQHTTAPYDIAVALPPGTDPAPYAQAGATWWLAEFEPEAVSLDQVRGVLRDGPAVPLAAAPHEEQAGSRHGQDTVITMTVSQHTPPHACGHDRRHRAAGRAARRDAAAATPSRAGPDVGAVVAGNRATVPSTGPLRWVLTLDGNRLAGSHLPAPHHADARDAA